MLYFQYISPIKWSLKCVMCDSYLYHLYLHSLSLSCVHHSSIICLSPLFSLMSSFLLCFHIYVCFPICLPPHVASCLHCMWAPISGPPILWARWSCLLWETLWYGEGIKDRLDVDCCPVSLPGYNLLASIQGLLYNISYQMLFSLKSNTCRRDWLKLMSWEKEIVFSGPQLGTFPNILFIIHSV